MKSIKKFKNKTAACVLFMLSIIHLHAQPNGFIDIDSMKNEIAMRVGEMWVIDALNDSVILIELKEIIRIDNYQTRAGSKHKFRLYILFNNEKCQDAKNRQKEFNGFLDEKNRDFQQAGALFSFSALYKKSWEELIPKKLPPNIIFEDYSITIIPNMPAFAMEIKEVEVWAKMNSDISQILLFLTEEGCFTTYTKHLTYYKLHYPCYNMFGLIDWSDLVPIKYPEWAWLGY